jgi:hypothetical protein
MSFKRLPGTARNYVDTSTGEVMSRIERDKRIGALFESGFRTYGERKASVDNYKSGVNKIHEKTATFDVKGVTDISKAMQYVAKNAPVSSTAFFSVRVKTKEGKWLSSKTGDHSSISGFGGALLSKYELDLSDIDEIELYVMD